MSPASLLVLLQQLLLTLYFIMQHLLLENSKCSSSGIYRPLSSTAGTAEHASLLFSWGPQQHLFPS